MAVLPPDPVFSLRCAEMGPVNSICFHQNERLLAGTARGTVHLWDLQTNRSSFFFDVGTDSVISLHHTDDVLLTQEKGGKLKKWSVSNSGYVLATSMTTNHIGFCRTDLSQDGKMLITPKDDNLISLLNVEDLSCAGELSAELSGGNEKLGFLTCLKHLNMNGQCYVLAGYESGHLLTWDVRCNKIMNKFKVDELVMSLDFDAATNRGVCAGMENRITVISYQRQTLELTKCSEIGIKNAGINCLRIRNDQKVFVSGGTDSRIRIFSWKSLRPLAVLTEHKSGGINDIAFTNGKVHMWNAPIMAAAGADSQISLWDLYN